MKKTARIAVLFILLASVFPFIIGCSAAEFEMSALMISAEKIITGETVNVTANIANIGTAEGEYAAVLKLNGTVLETENVTLAPGTNRQLCYCLTENCTGTHTVSLGDLNATYEIVEPARIEYSSLKVEPEEVMLSDSVTVTVDATNPGGVTGNFTCDLLVNDYRRKSQEVILESGETTNLTFEFTPSYSSGNNTIAIGDMEKTITMIKPALLLIREISLDEDQIETGGSLTLRVEVENTGDIEGTMDIEPEIDDEPYTTKTVIVGPGDKHTAQIKITSTDIGPHTIDVKAESEYFTVTPPVPDGYKGYVQSMYSSGWSSFFYTDFFIVYPEEWLVDNNDLAYTFMGPVYDDGTYPSLNILSESIPEGMSLEDFFNILKGQFQQLYDYDAVSTEDMTISGIDAIKHICKLTSNGVEVTSKQIILIDDNGTAIVIVAGTLTAYYDEYEDIFNTMIDSFMIFEEDEEEE